MLKQSLVGIGMMSAFIMSGCQGEVHGTAIDAFQTQDSSGSSSGSGGSSGSSGSGSGSSGTPTHFVYIANQDDDTISQFGIDPVSGKPSPLAGNETVATCSKPMVIKFHVSLPLLYVICYNDSKIWIYLRNDTTGALSLYDNTNNIGALMNAGGFNAAGTVFSVKQDVTPIVYWRYSVHATSGMLTFLNSSSLPISGIDYTNYTSRQYNSNYYLIHNPSNLLKFFLPSDLMNPNDTDSTGNNPSSLEIH